MASGCFMGSFCKASIHSDAEIEFVHRTLLPSEGQSLAKLGRFAEAARELRVAARITEEEGDTPMQSYIRELIALVTSALNRTLSSDGAEDPKTQSSRSDEADQRITGRSRLADRTETIITCSQKRTVSEYKDHGSSSEALDEDTTTHLEDLKRFDLDNLAPRGDSTFRVPEPAKTSQDEEDASSVCSESSSATSSYELGQTGILEEDSDEVSVRAAETDVRGEGASGSQTSETSMNTDATYVIEDQDDDAAPGRMGAAGVCGRTVARKEDDAAESSVRMIEQLAMEDPELLKMARNLLMMSGTGDRSRDSGDAERFGIFWAGVGRD